MKKVLLFSSLLIIGGSLFLYSPSYAEEPELVVETTSVTEDIKSYAKNEFTNYLNGYLNIENKNIHSSEYKLLEPFQYILETTDQIDNKTNIFPIEENGVIKYNFFVNKNSDGTYSSKLSPFLADELQALKHTLIFGESIALLEKNQDIYLKKDDYLEKIYTNPMNIKDEPILNETQVQEEIEATPTEVIELSTLSETNQSTAQGRSVTTNSQGTLINWTITETQGTEPWCVPYVTAMILNNKNDKRPTTAKQIVQFINKQDDSNGYNSAEMIRYANSRGVYPKFVNKPIGWSDVLTQVRKSNGVFGLWKSYGEAAKRGDYHALAIIGTYSAPAFGGGTNKAYYVWNPWYSHIELANFSNNTYYDQGSHFVWTLTLTNW